MGVIVSPGVYSTEKDFSLYAPQLATSIFGVVGTASKGPTDEITLITDEASLINTFGVPSSSHLGLAAAVRYLRKGKQLKFVRVAHYDLTAQISITAVGGSAGTVQAASSGSWGNSISVVVASSTYYSGSYKFTVKYGTSAVEVFDNCVLGSPTSSNYWATKINGVSDYIMITSINDANTNLTAGTYTLTGGDDGASVTNSDIIGSVGTPPTVPGSGLSLFRNGEVVDVNLLAVPGNTHRSIIAELIDLCSSRGDCMTILDSPQNMSVSDAVDWHNGLGSATGAPTSALNSSYAALYYPWLQVYDGFSDAEVWVPPSGHVAQVMAFTDFVADPWWAPAGFNRALLTDVLQVEHSATQGERDFMYSGGNAVNPIISAYGKGTVIWGQRTLQRTTTALDRINVRRLTLYIRKIVATAVVNILFEPNDETTWRSFVRLVEPIMAGIKNRRGVYDYKVICDSTVNTPEIIARNEMIGKILFQPTKTAEMISVEATLLPTGARFEEFV